GKPLGVSKGNNKTGKIAPKKRCSPRVKRSREKRKLIRRMIFVIIVTILATSAGFISYNLVINSIQL
ncbi:MAG: hypothetical protein RR645_03585, partial [Clostridium sp.]